jgi:hypothetical protein
MHSTSLVLSRFEVNSSKSNKFGLFTNAWDKNTLCLSPPDKVPMDFFFCFNEFVNSSTS